MKMKIMAMMISAMCLATTSLNCVNVVNAADEETNVPFLIGDVNEDGYFEISDVVLLQKWLLSVPNTHLANWKAADFCDDNSLDVFDLNLMKRALIEKLNGSSELDNPEVREVLFGYPDSGSGASAPMSSIRTALKCKAFCPSDKSLKVDVAMLGMYEPKGYDDYAFLYEYSIYPCDNGQRIDDTRLTVNGEIGSCTKEYTGEERNIFNLGREYDDFSTYHHETAELGFSGYPAGSSGSIVFMLKSISLNEDGTMPEHPSFLGGGQVLYFYVGEEGVGISNTSVEDAEESYRARGAGEIPTPDTYTGRWHGKNISYDLYEALKNPDSEMIPVMVTFKDTGATEFVYQGRTIQEYTNDLMCNDDISRLEQLLEQGDVIKYGEVVYTTGTPDGVIWTEEMYNYRVKFYGEELLSRYIVDGEFLKEQLQADLTELKKGYKAALDEAVEAFYIARIEETISKLEAQSIRSKRIEGTHDVVMYVTTEEFNSLNIDTASCYGIAFQEQSLL